MINDIAVKTYTEYFKINSKFIYNLYEKDEAVINDNIISSSKNDLTDVKKRYVKLFEKNNNFKKFENYNILQIVKQKYPEVFSYIKDINYKNFNNQQDIFNKIENLFPNRKSLYSFTSDIDIIKNIKNLTDNNASENLDQIFTNLDQFNDNDGTFYNYFEQFKTTFNHNEFDVDEVKNQFIKNTLTSSNIDELKKMKSIKLNELENKNNSYINSGDFIGNAIPFCSFINTIDEDENYSIPFIGFYIEKFLVQQNENIKIASMFYTPFIDQKLYQNNSFYIEDGNIKYGSTYLYSISRVFCYIMPKKNNYLLNEAYFICDYPYITQKIECIDKDLPPPPDNLNINIVNEQIEISWDYPSNSKGDVKGMQILKRSTLDEPYTLISYEINDFSNDFYIQQEKIDSQSIKINKNNLPYSFIDKNFDRSKPQIYSLRSITAHGNLSNYSSQIAVMYDWINKKLIYELISEKNAPFDYPNIYVNNNTYMFDEIDTAIENTPVNNSFSKIKVYITPDCVLINDEQSLYSDKQYKFSMLKLNDKTINDISFNIKNFNL